MNRRSFLAGIAASAAATSAFAKTPGIKPATIQKAPAATKQIPSMKAIRKSLALPNTAVTVTPQMKSSVVEIKRKKALRHIAPSIDIQAINFAFGSAEIPYQEHWKVERIAAALHDILHYSPDELFLIEGTHRRRGILRQQSATVTPESPVAAETVDVPVRSSRIRARNRWFR